MIQREKDILKTLDHPNIVKLKEVVEDPDKEKCHMLSNTSQAVSYSRTLWHTED